MRILFEYHFKMETVQKVLGTVINLITQTILTDK